MQQTVQSASAQPSASPPPSRLVGRTHWSSATTNLNSLFNDGVHITYSFLDTQEWNAMLSVAKRFYTIAQTSEPCRNIIISPPVSLPLLCASSLRRHISTLTHRTISALSKYHTSYDPKFEFLVMSTEQLISILTSLSSLTSLAVEMKDRSPMVDDSATIIFPSTRLTHLHLCSSNHTSVHWPSHSDTVILSIPTFASHLTHLHVTNWRWNKNMKIDLLVLLECKSLTRLDLDAGLPDRRDWDSEVKFTFSTLMVLTERFQHLTHISFILRGGLMRAVLAHPNWSYVNLPQMREVNYLFFEEPWGIRNFATVLVRALPGLTKLNVNTIHLDDVIVLSQLTKLQSLIINHIGEHSDQFITSLCHCHSLTHLDCNGPRIRSTKHWSQLFSSMPELISLRIVADEETNVLDELMEAKFHDDQCVNIVVASRIRYLNLRSNVSEIQLRLFLSHATHLRRFIYDAYLLEFLSLDEWEMEGKNRLLQMKSIFASSTVAPELERLELYFLTRFIWDHEQHRLRKNGEQLFLKPDSIDLHFRTSSVAEIPPSPRLVGIESNPGPQTMNLKPLFTDGVHIIFSFLQTKEWNFMIQTRRDYTLLHKRVNHRGTPQSPPQLYKTNSSHRKCPSIFSFLSSHAPHFVATLHSST